jgi:4-amino-4-deoxy-L-arabinose transferase
MTTAEASGPERALERRTSRLLLLLVLATAFAFQGTRGLYETTEGRYAEIAREMLATGDFGVPHLDGRPHWTKPPLAYWSIALGLELLGRNAWGARLFGALAFVLLTLALVSLGESLWDRETGLLAGLVFATSPFPVLAAFAVSPDLLLALWESLAVLCYWRAFRAPGARWIPLAWVCFALAFLTKGPPGLLPLAAMLAFGFAARRRGLEAPRLLDPLGIALFCGLGLSWYLAAIAHDRSLLASFLADEVWGRVATDMHRRNPRWFMPAVVFAPPLTLGLGAWLVVALRDARAGLAPAGWRAGIREGLRAPAGLFVALWLAIPLAVFCLSRSRLPLYVLPLFPVVALLAARALRHARGADAALRSGTRIALASAVVWIAVKGLSTLAPLPQDMGRLAAHVRALAPGARVLVLDQRGLHGLAFHLDQRLERIASEDLAEALRGIEAALQRAPAERMLLLTTGATPAALARACARLDCRAEDAAGGRLRLHVLSSPRRESAR